MKSFPLYTQHDAMDCGPTCLRMVTAFYGRHFSLQYLRENCFISRQGVSMLGISEAAEKLGMHTIGLRIPISRLINDVPLPCIVHWNQNHFVVLYQIEKRKNGYLFHIADPAGSKVTYTEEEFKRCWLSGRNDGEDNGDVITMFVHPNCKNCKRVYQYIPELRKKTTVKTVSLASNDAELHEYCRKNQINKTPTVVFNGRELSDIYDIEDLKYVI
jgi:ATP-binding cassette subfamily B protein